MKNYTCIILYMPSGPSHAYSVFCNSMKQLGVVLLPLDHCDASPLQGYPQHEIHWNPFENLGGERHWESTITTQCPLPGLEPRWLDQEIICFYLLG